MKRILLLVAMGGLVALTSAACSGPTSATSDQDVADQVARTRRVLTSASTLAGDYGTEHLGHYLKLRLKDLESAGLQIPDDVTVEVITDHSSYCIEITNKALPSIHEWRKATSTSRMPRPDPTDQCIA